VLSIPEWSLIWQIHKPLVKACVPPIGDRARVGRRARPVKARTLPTGGRRRSGRRARFVKAASP